MRIVDVCAFYTPAGGGVRTYVEAKLLAAARLGHEMVVIAPGEREEIVEYAPGAVIATLPSPRLPVDRRYRYFNDEAALHRSLDAWRPDHVEASSPWTSAGMVGRWQGPASRSLIMHSDPLAAYPYRWLGGIASTATIDRCFAGFWRYLRGLDGMFDLVVSANSKLTERLRDGGVGKAETIPIGVEAGLFSPAMRSAELRGALLRRLGLDSSAILLVGIGRLSAEKRWDMVVRAAARAGREHPVGLVLVGDGPRRDKLEALTGQSRSTALLPRIDDRRELARLLASADALVHGCECETFCMAAAEARASGIPLIVPDGGAAIDQLVAGAGLSYRSADQHSLERAIVRFLDHGPELQRARAAQHVRVRTMDEHFAGLVERYAQLVVGRPPAAAALADSWLAADPMPALASSASHGSFGGLSRP